MNILKNLRTPLIIVGLSMLVGGISSCEKDDIEEDNDEELITTMSLKFTPVTGGTSTTFKFDDPDGPGGTAPTLEDIRLNPNTAYNVEVQLLNKTANPVEDVTLEVKAEADAHRFYYLPSANVTVSNYDKDANGVTLGIKSTWTTTNAGTGNIIVILRHYANNPPGKLESDLASDPKSDTDIQVIFPVVIL
jgi:hypothetical protein